MSEDDATRFLKNETRAAREAVAVEEGERVSYIISEAVLLLLLCLS